MRRWTARFGGTLACALALGTTAAIPAGATPRGTVPTGATSAGTMPGGATSAGTMPGGGTPAGSDRASIAVGSDRLVAAHTLVGQAARGVSVRITELPDRFVAGAAPETVTVVATKAGGGGCLKVRWSMVLRLEGLSLEQVRVDRIEENGSFPVDVRDEGGDARVTDEQLDPGTLCRDRTVTARYRLNVANDVRDGELTLLAEAYDADLRLLERDGATLTVAGVARPEPSASAEESAEPTADPGAGAVATDPADPDPAGAGAPAGRASAAADERQGLPLAWFLIGGLMVFLGLSLLLNVRWRQRNEPTPAQVPAASLSGYRTVPRRPRGW